MKTLTKYIIESNGYYQTSTDDIYKDLQPKNKKQLVEIIKKRLKDNDKKLDLSNVDVSNITDMSHLFASAHQTMHENVVEINISGWDTRHVTDMSYMFGDCHALTNIIGIEELNVSHVEYMRCMFWGCYYLEGLDLSKWDVRYVSDMSGMFTYCENLYNLDVHNWKVSSDVDTYDMFRHCESLQKLPAWYKSEK